MARWKKIVNEAVDVYEMDDDQYKLHDRISRTLWSFTGEMYGYFCNKYDGGDKDSEVGNEAF